MPGHRAELAERAAPGAPEDAIVWEIVVGHAADNTRSSWSYHAFLCLATMIAGVAVITDSPVLVVGAMVVGPEFGPVSALAVALVLRRWRLARRAIRLLVLGFAWRSPSRRSWPCSPAVPAGSPRRTWRSRGP